MGGRKKRESERQEGDIEGLGCDSNGQSWQVVSWVWGDLAAVWVASSRCLTPSSPDLASWRTESHMQGFCKGAARQPRASSRCGGLTHGKSGANVSLRITSATSPESLLIPTLNTPDLSVPVAL